MIDRTQLKTYSSFEAADEAERQERWAMTIEERINLLEQLRSFQYPDGETALRMQKVIEFVRLPQR